MNNMKKEQLRLYAVTDRTWLGNETLYQQVEKALEGGATLVQLREKELPEADVQKEAEELLELCHRYGVKLILDDDVELAAKVGADGVHIGQSDMELAHAREILGPDKIIGVTAKTVEQAKAAEAGGADYLGSGAVFGSTTKKDAIPMKHELLEEICHSVKIPVVAIGGITAENVLQLKGRGIAGVAVVSGIFACEDIETGTRHLGELVEQIIKSKMKNHLQIKKLTLTALFTAVAVVGSMFSFPVLGSKCAPVQHLVNVLCAVTVGPWWGLAQAFMAALIRNLTGLGSPLAFPGSMCGALLAGLLYQYGKKLPFAYVGEVFGTGIIGGMLSYPIAYLIMGNKAAALFTFVVPFLISTCGGTIIAIIVTIPMKKAGILDGEIQRREKL